MFNLNHTIICSTKKTTSNALTYILIYVDNLMLADAKLNEISLVKNTFEHKT